ncbi:MAG: type II secretion system protein E [Firmicutes bacterium HGW-Firmicutes-13]|nr:MAG: type II secretion system protein E [Firmicutes bacterium HGW-Firmicutes-13]
MSLLKRLEQEKSHEQENNNVVSMTKAVPIKQDPHREIKVKIHKVIIEELKTDEVKNKEDHEQADIALAEKIKEIAQKIFDSEDNFIPEAEREQIIRQLKDEVLGYGPITPFIEDPDISEIMVNGADEVYVERKGKIELTDVYFRDDHHVHHIIEKIVSPLGRRIDESMPMVDARLPDGSRVNAIIHPLSLTGPIITIRKFSKDPLKIKDLVRFGTLTPQMAQFVDACVKSRLNIVVSGGTGSGKTTTLNVLSSFIPNDERIITIEDAAELQLHQRHVISLETRPPNIEGKGAITMRDLVRNSLRMRPDRIVVGEVRGGEALDMLQAMNTGHDGSLTTGHANSPRDILSRLETMVLMAGMDLPIRAIREQISSAVDLIVHQSRMKDGTRKITYITEVLQMEGDVIVLQDIFKYIQTDVGEKGKVKGTFEATGIQPKFLDKIKASGIKLSEDVFHPSKI